MAERKYDRVAKTIRSTKETDIEIRVNIDGLGKADISTGFPFIDHIITSFAKHSMIDINVHARSNDSIVHHLIEDTAICLSQTLDKALSDRNHIMRFGYALVPMDDSLASVSLDLIRRQYCKISMQLINHKTEEICKEDIEHFVRSLAVNLNACIHIDVKYGENDHHKVESAIKAFAVALRMAVNIDPKREGVPSTKGEM